MKRTKRCVCTNFWEDTKVMDQMSPDERLIMLWLLTNPATTMLGIYEFSLSIMSAQTGYSKDMLKTILKRFDEDYRIIKWSPETSEVAILNSMRHGILGGGTPVKSCLERDEKSVKNKKLLKAVIDHLKTKEDIDNQTVLEYLQEVEMRLEGIVEEEVEEISDKKEKEVQEQNEDIQETVEKNGLKLASKRFRFNQKEADEIINYLNLRAGTHFRANTPKTIKLIKSRMKEGFTTQDFMKVIEIKVRTWKGTEWDKFLRPETLFGTKFESYLNERVKPIREEMPF